MAKKYILTDPGPTAQAFQIAYQKEINPSQWEVVSQAEGACLVLAGAGSGKTRTLIYRVAYLLEKGVPPEEILLVTFTNKAAQEMKNRIEVLLRSRAQGLWCGTFHHVGHRLLRRHARTAGLREDFSILDEEDSADLIKSCVKSLAGRGQGSFPKPRVVQSILSFAVNARRELADVVAARYPYFAPFVGDLGRVKRLYEERKARSNNLDYDDLLLRWIGLLRDVPALSERLTRQFRYCLVDEYQDTNRLQHEIIRLVASHHRNILVVGDDAQSIYSFRAAEIRNILDFPKDYPEARIFKLETNYRSTKSILTLANESIKHNVHQFPKTLQSVHGKGGLPQLVKVRDHRQEARFVVQRIADFTAQDVDLSEIAVLFRAHYQAAELELELAKRGIPYVIRGGVRFFEQAHVKDVLAFLRILQNPLDEIAWTRALTLQPGIGSGYAERIFQEVQRDGGGLERAASAGFGDFLPPKAKDGFAGFKKIVRSLLHEEVKNHPDMLIEEVLSKGYSKHVLLAFENAQERLDDLRELVNFAHTYKKLKDFLADTTLREGFRGESLLEAPEDAGGGETLVLSTIHQAKGLEWRAVILIGLSEGLFPHAKSLQSAEELEEERRLFYVASTRAKEELVLVHPMTRYDYAAGTVILRPSVFTAELPSRVYEEVEVGESREEETLYLDEEA